MKSACGSTSHRIIFFETITLSGTFRRAYHLAFAVTNRTNGVAHRQRSAVGYDGRFEKRHDERSAPAPKKAARDWDAGGCSCIELPWAESLPSFCLASQCAYCCRPRWRL